MKHFVYRFMCKDKVVNVTRILYTGETNNIDRRMGEHFISGDNVNTECYDTVTRIEYIEFNNSADAKLFEIYYINMIKPPFNVKDKMLDCPTTIPHFDILFDSWQVYEEGDIRHIIAKKKQEKYNHIQSLIQDFEQTNRRLTELTSELQLTHKKMKDIIDKLGKEFREHNIYGCKYNKAQYITREGQKVIKNMLKVA